MLWRKVLLQCMGSDADPLNHLHVEAIATEALPLLLTGFNQLLSALPLCCPAASATAWCINLRLNSLVGACLLLLQADGVAPYAGGVQGSTASMEVKGSMHQPRASQVLWKPCMRSCSVLGACKCCPSMLRPLKPHPCCTGTISAPSLATLPHLVLTRLYCAFNFPVDILQQYYSCHSLIKQGLPLPVCKRRCETETAT